MKARWYECGGRILLGDGTAAIAVVLRPIRFQCVGVWAFGFELDSLLCTLNVYEMLQKFRLATNFLERNYCIK
jgi:hypothetical protein